MGTICVPYAPPSPPPRLAFPFISLAESGLFKGLRAKKQKNPARAQLAFEVASRAPANAFRPPSFFQPVGPFGLIR